MTRRIAAPLLLAAALAACTAPLSTVAQRHEQQETRIPVATPVPAQDRLVAVNPSRSAPPIIAKGEELETAAIETNLSPTPSPTSRSTSSERPAPRRRAAAAFDPGRLIGMGRDQVVALLGTPTLLRRDPPAELWLYEGQSCTAHLFLYQDSQDGDYQVRHLETQVGQDQADAGAACLANLMTRGDGRFGLLR